MPLRANYRFIPTKVQTVATIHFLLCTSLALHQDAANEVAAAVAGEERRSGIGRHILHRLRLSETPVADMARASAASTLVRTCSCRRSSGTILQKLVCGVSLRFILHCFDVVYALCSALWSSVCSICHCGAWPRLASVILLYLRNLLLFSSICMWLDWAENRDTHVMIQKFEVVNVLLCSVSLISAAKLVSLCACNFIHGVSSI